MHFHRGVDPVVVDGLVGDQNEGVALGGEDFERVNSQRFVTDAVHLAVFLST